jgi:hypothetical protein
MRVVALIFELLLLSLKQSASQIDCVECPYRGAELPPAMDLSSLSLNDDGLAEGVGAAAADVVSTEAEDALKSQEEEDKPADPELLAMTDPVREKKS